MFDKRLTALCPESKKYIKNPKPEKIRFGIFSIIVCWKVSHGYPH